MCWSPIPFLQMWNPTSRIITSRLIQNSGDKWQLSLVKFRGNYDQVCQQTWPLHSIIGCTTCWTSCKACSRHCWVCKIQFINLVAEKKNKKAEDNSLDTTMVTIQQQHFSGQGSTSRSSGGYNLPQSEYGTMASHQVAFQFAFANPIRLHSSSKCCMRQPKEKDLGKERCQSGRTLNIQVWVSARKLNIVINLIKNKVPRLHKQLSIAEFITAFGR